MEGELTLQFDELAQAGDAITQGMAETSTKTFTDGSSLPHRSRGWFKTSANSVTTRSWRWVASRPTVSSFCHSREG